MKVLMISTDATLLGKNGIGDAVARHAQYASQVERLDILVLTKIKEPNYQIADNCLAQSITFWRCKSLSQKICQQNSYDLIVCQDPFITGSLGVWLKRKLGIKLIIHFHGDFLDNPYWLKEHHRNRVYQRMAERNIHLADSIRVVSQGIKEKLTKRGVKAQDIYRISTPVNLAQFDSGQPTPSNSQIVLTVGRIVKAKDFPTLIKAAEQVYQSLPGFKWLIIGDGPLLLELKKKTKDQPYFEWLGHKDHNELNKYYQQAALVVLTSNNESFGKVFLEAAMAYRPAVATDTVGAQEIIIDGQSGYIVPIGDYQRLAERIIYLLQNPQLTQKMGQQAHQLVKERFDGQKNIQKIINMWHQTVGH